MENPGATLSVWFLGLLETLSSVILFSHLLLSIAHNKSPPKLGGLRHQQYIIITCGFFGQGVWAHWVSHAAEHRQWLELTMNLCPLYCRGLSLYSLGGLVWDSSPHAALGADWLLTWKLKSSRASISGKQKLHHFWWYSLRGHAASLLPHSTGYQWVTSPPRFKRRVIRLHAVMGNSKKGSANSMWDWRYYRSHLWKIQSATSQKGKGILENQKCHLRCLKRTKILHLMQRTIYNIKAASRRHGSIAAYSSSECSVLCSHKNDPNICPCLWRVWEPLSPHEPSCMSIKCVAMGIDDCIEICKMWFAGQAFMGPDSTWDAFLQPGCKPLETEVYNRSTDTTLSMAASLVLR